MPRPRGSGCITCRIRRVKCDEQKPHCKRCISTGRRCDGYEPATAQHSRRELAEMAQRSAGKQRASSPPLPLTQAPAASSITSPSREREYQLFDMFRHSTVPSTTSVMPSQFWNEVLQLSHVEAAVWHAMAALAALHHHWQKEIASRVLAVGEDIETHYFRAVSLGKDVNSTATAVALSLTLGAAANMMGRIREGRMHIMSGREMLLQCERLKQRSHAADMMARLDLEAMSIGDTAAPYQSQDTVALRHGVITVCAFESYEQAADDLIRLFRISMMVDEDVVLELPGPTVPEDYLLKGLRAWQVNMAAFEKRHEGSEPSSKLDDTTSAISVRLYHDLLLISLVKGRGGAETRFDACLDVYVRMMVLAEGLAQRLEQGSQTVTLEPGLIMALFILGTTCRHSRVRRWCLDLLKRAKRREGLWRSDLAAMVMQRAIEVEEEEALLGARKRVDIDGGADLERSTTIDEPDHLSEEVQRTRLQEALSIQWEAWAKPGFRLPSWESWNGVTIIPEECRIKDFKPTIAIADRYIKLSLTLSSRTEAPGKAREEVIVF